MAWSNETKNTASYTNESRNTGIWDYLGDKLLLLESGYLLLLETTTVPESRLLLESSRSISGDVWENQSKN